MGNLITLAALFVAKVTDNALSTTKTILVQRSRWILAGIAVIISDFIYFWITKRVVSADLSLIHIQMCIRDRLRAGSIEDEEDTRPSPLDELFAELEMTNPDHIALKYYRSYHSGSAKTLKSIQITLAARLEKFNLESCLLYTSRCV